MQGLLSIRPLKSLLTAPLRSKNNNTSAVANIPLELALAFIGGELSTTDIRAIALVKSKSKPNKSDRVAEPMLKAVVPKDTAVNAKSTRTKSSAWLYKSNKNETPL